MIQVLQDEMSTEQDRFNELKSQLQQCDGDNFEARKLTEDMLQSQNTLKELMEKTRLCFNQVTISLYFSPCYSVNVSLFMGEVWRRGSN